MSFDRDRDKMRAERLVVLIDNDPVLSERLSAVLGSYGLRVQVIPDGNDLLTGAQLMLVLIVLCIDPKRLGWAICNRIKKTVQYRDVPLIVTSQEATEKDFEDHKKLRTRAAAASSAARCSVGRPASACCKASRDNSSSPMEAAFSRSKRLV